MRRDFHRSTVDEHGRDSTTAYCILGARLLIGWIFLYSGLGKLAEHGLAYSYASTWLNEAIPVATPAIETGFPGILQAPLAILVKLGATVIDPLFQIAASLPFTGALVVIFEIGIGLGLMLGCATRLFSFLGASMMVLFYYGNAEWSHGLVNSDLVYLLLFVLVAAAGAGRVAGVDAWLEEQTIVNDHPWLRYLLG